MKKAKINVAIILPFLTLGGAETQALNIAKGLKKSGVNIKVFAFQEKNGMLKKHLENLNIPYELIDYDLNWIHQTGPRKVFGLLKIIKALKSIKPDYLFPFTYYPNIVSSAVWKLTGAKECFWNQRGLERIPLNAIEKIAIKMKPSYISNSITGAKFITKRHHLKDNKVKVIRNGVILNPPKKTPQEWRKDLEIEETDLCYLMVANFYPEKNHTFLLEGWKLFCEKNSDKSLKLILIGYSSQEIGLLRIKAKAYELMLNNIIILDSSNDISGLLQICQCGILTSESEGCPNAVLEYMAWKVPAIVSKIPATSEIFNEQYPLFCELGDIYSLYRALNLSLDQILMEKTQESNLKILSDKFNFKTLINKYRSIIENNTK